MARLLELASRFVNLGIVGSITPAGALMALALVLWMAEPKRETPSETLLNLFSPDYRLTQQLKELRDSRRCENRKWQQALTRVAEKTRLAGQAEADLAHATELRNSVRAVFLDRWTGRHGLREEASSALQEYEESVKTHSGNAAQAGKSLAAAQATEALQRASVESLDDRIAAVREQHSEQIPVAIGGLFQSVMLILLLGWLIGIVLNPINKALLNSGFGLFSAVCSWKEKKKAAKEKEERKLKHALYYVGKNVITQEEYDDLVNRYHRFAQILASLCLPALALGWALSYWHTSHWYRHPFLIAVLVSLLLWVLAACRYCSFRTRVDILISGRLCDIEEQRRREKIKELQGNLAGLTKLIKKIEKLLDDYQSCCCAKCKPKLAPCFTSLTKAVTKARTLLKGARPCCLPEMQAEVGPVHCGRGERGHRDQEAARLPQVILLRGAQVQAGLVLQGSETNRHRDRESARAPGIVLLPGT